MIYKNVNGTQKLVTNIRKPKKWRRFEYLQSSGIECIDTNYLLLSNSVKCLWCAEDNGATTTSLFGSEYQSENPKFSFVLHGSNTNRKLFIGNSGSLNVGYTSSTATDNWELNIDNGTAKLIKNNSIVGNVSYSGLLKKTVSIAIFGNKRLDTYILKVAVKLYYWKLYDNDVLVRDLVPCQYNGQYGMWDLVEDKFYGNKGTGTFTVGPEIANYDEIEKLIVPKDSNIPKGLEFYTYLLGDGQAYIDTECLLNRASTISITMQLTAKTNQDRYVGILKSGLNILMYSGDSGNNIKTYTNITSGGSYGTLIAHNTNIHHYYINDSSHKSYCDGTAKVTHTSVPTTDDYLGSCYLFWANGAASGGQATCRIYSCQIYNNNVLARDLHPCCYLREPGVWDTVENKFYGNAGSGNLILGDKITNDLKEVSTSMPLYDPTIHTEPDGSEWVHIFHHNNPVNNLFASTDTFLSLVHTDANRWFDVSYCFKLQKFEFLLKQSLTTGGTEYKYRWVQNINPMVAGFNDVPRSKVTYITSTGYTNPSTAYGGLCRGIGSTYLRANNNAANNWWGAIGAWGLSSGYVPSWNGQQVTTGCIDLYVRKFKIYLEIPIWILKNALVGDGKAYIETNFIPTKYTEVRLKFDELANNSSTYYPVIHAYASGIELFTKANVNYAGYNGTAEKLFTGPNSSLAPVEVILKHNYFEANGVVYIDTAVNTNLNPSRSLPIFGYKNQSNTMDSRRGSHRLYYLKIYDNNVLVRDFVPATMGGRPGLYDKVNHKMYFNANSSGNFTVE